MAGTSTGFVILASASPQRRALLEKLAVPFIAVPPLLAEERIECNAEAMVQQLAHDKAAACLSILRRQEKSVLDSRGDAVSDAAHALRKVDGCELLWILGADTVVVQEEHVLGKPGDEQAAKTMLRRLSGRTHRVLTGVCLFSANVDSALRPGKDRAPLGGFSTAYAETHVTFARLSDSEVRWYLASNEWQGAAGAYRIQGKGESLVESIRGSYSNVVGLPIRLVYGMLMQHKFPL